MSAVISLTLSPRMCARFLKAPGRERGLVAFGPYTSSGAREGVQLTATIKPASPMIWR
jgi:multidrug efflux pump subunit AcrB